MLIGEIISRIRTTNKLVGADTRISDRYIYNQLLTKRDHFIKLEDDKKKLLNSTQIFKPLHQVDLIDVNKVEVSDLDLGEVIKRTKLKLPKIVMAGFGPVIRRVSSLDGSQLLTETKETTYSRKVNLDTAKYDRTLYYYLKDGYMYLPNIPWESISIDAYFEDPFEIDALNNCEDNCSPMQDREFLIPSYLKEVIIQSTAEEIGRYYVRLREDININKNPNN
jgi:hypothetical protein